MCNSKRSNHIKKIIIFIIFLIFPIQVYATSSFFWKTVSTLKSVQITLYLFYMDIGRYPSTIEGLHALYQKPANVIGWNGPYLDKTYPIKDAWGQELTYIAFPKIQLSLKNKDNEKGKNINLQTKYILYSIGANGKDEEGDGDDITLDCRYWVKWKEEAECPPWAK